MLLDLMMMMMTMTVKNDNGSNCEVKEVATVAFEGVRGVRPFAHGIARK